MQLSKNITLDQMIASKVAQERGFDNAASVEIITNLKQLAENILEPVLNHFGGQLDITSGYRCQPLNRFIGSSDSSQHCLGEAVDFGIIDEDIYAIASWIKDNLDYDHLILEKYNPQDLNKGWVHCSYRHTQPNRKIIQTFDGKIYYDGLLKLPLQG